MFSKWTKQKTSSKLRMCGRMIIRSIQFKNQAIIGCQKYPYLLRKLLATSYWQKENTDTMIVFSAKRQTQKTSGCQPCKKVMKDEGENDCISFVIGQNLHTQNSTKLYNEVYLVSFKNFDLNLRGKCSCEK